MKKVVNRKTLIKNVAVLLIASISITLVYLYLENNKINYKLENAMFVVGIFMFLIGIATITKAFNIFNNVTYMFHKFRNKEYKETYYDYTIRKREQKRLEVENMLIFYGIALIILSLLI